MCPDNLKNVVFLFLFYKLYFQLSKTLPKKKEDRRLAKIREKQVCIEKLNVIHSSFDGPPKRIETF